MALQRQSVEISFHKGLDTKTDPWRLTLGNFVSLKNIVFDKLGQLTKRNGFGLITSLVNPATSLSTYKNSLVAIGSTLQSFSADSNQWISVGNITPVKLNTVPLVRTSTSQVTVDAAVSANGLVCEAWLDANTNIYYQISDSTTGQIIKSQTLIGVAVSPRVFCLGQYFVVTYLATSGGGTHLKYIAIPITNPTTALASTDISTVVESLTAGYDGVVSNNALYLAYSASDGGGAVRVTYLSSILAQGATKVLAGRNATRVSLTADISGSNSIIWVTYLAKTSNDVVTQAYSAALATILAPTVVYSATPINNLTSLATSGVLTLFTELPGTYSYTPNAVTNNVTKIAVTQAGAVGIASTVKRGVGLGSKAFYIGTTMYMLLAYGQAYQPTYFLIDSSGTIVARLAYSNGGGYNTSQVLPGANVSSDGDSVSIGYLFVDQLVPVNKTQGTTNVNGVYTQTGINLATFEFVSTTSTLEIANDLHLTGGFLSMYDGTTIAEHGFHVWPEDIAIANAGGGGLSAQQYYYVSTYEWTDAQGNLHRSAPSVPQGIVSVATGTNTVNVPMLRLTAKQNVRIVLWRWSVAQPTYYQVTTVAAPNINVPTTDSIAITDVAPDASILGNAILYTTGGVIEDICAPATDIFTLFKSRLFILDSEDRNLIWFSKQVIAAVPVEMSDLLTLYVAPTLGAQGSTGPITALSSMDDKLIIFKANAAYYVTGQGPDNTGANNDFSDPVFITATVGCANPSSIVLTPNGLMFQSNKGIWLLGRDLSTNYIGAPVEEFNDDVVNSALVIPGTNQVRFTFDSGVVLFYDYFVGQWAEAEGVSAISSTIYGDLHTYMSKSVTVTPPTGAPYVVAPQVLQETPGKYLDNTVPVVMSFLTGWINLDGLQRYKRFYFMEFLAKYFSPHKVVIGIAYDYNPTVRQTETIVPDNSSGNWGDGEDWGSDQFYGGTSSVEQWQVNVKQQSCQAFQISLNEYFDPTIGPAAGAGLTISSLELVVGIDKNYPRNIPAKHRVG